jgi:hypothetical protein
MHPPSALQCIALAVNTRASRGKGGRRGRMAAGGAAFDEGPSQGKTGQGQGQNQHSVPFGLQQQFATQNNAGTTRTCRATAARLSS